MAQPKYVLLDRDGVINHDSDAFIKSPDEWLPIDGSLEAIALLNKNDYQVIVITSLLNWSNMPGLGFLHRQPASGKCGQ
jgi:histidinol phosphatase-like enzyme